MTYFVAVSEAGTMSAAADRLDIAQPTLSRQIADLERLVGCQLLVRHSRGIVLTEAGTTFLEHARAITQQAQKAIVETSTRSRQANGMAALGAPHMMGRIIFGDVAEGYRDRFPDVTLRFAEGLSYVLLEWLHAGRLDLAILTNVRPDKRYRAAHLVSEPVYALMAPDHPLAKVPSDSISITALAQVPLIISSPLNQVRKLVMDAATARGVSLHVAIEAEDPETVKSLVARRLGVALLSYSAVADEVKRGQFSGKCVAGLRHDRYLVQRRDRPQTRAVAELARLVIATVDSKFNAGAFGRPSPSGGVRRHAESP
jgi:LysR family nitrogen assimilation transcriptional regulator